MTILNRNDYSSLDSISFLMKIYLKFWEIPKSL